MGKKALKRMEETVRFLQKKYRKTPVVGIILGSGLSNFIDELEIQSEVPYEKIPHFPVSTVIGHKGRLVFGILSGKPVVVMAGRFHYYEGYSPEEVAYPIRVMKMLGIKALLLSNAAGSVNPDFEVGDLMIIRDHVSFFVPNPLIGRNNDDWGPRFPDMSAPYNKDIINKVKEIARANDFPLKEGVYVAVTGPTFETKAEYLFIHRLGGDVVGMSTVQESIVANHMGLPVFAISVITDIGLRDDDNVITHEEVLEAANNAEPKLAAIFKALVSVL
jgi:purine-nucleoside phosphorylase